MPASEQPFGPAFEFAAIGMALLAPDSRVIAANPALCEMLGYTQEQFRDLPPHALSHAADRQEEVVQRSRLLAGTATDYQGERRLLHRNGRVVWSLVTCALERDAAGRALHFIAQVQDISRAKAAEALARDQSQLLDQARDAIVVHDLDGTIRYWNLGAQRMFRFDCEQAVGQTFESLMGPGAGLGAPAIAELLAAGDWTGELDCVDAAGRLIVVERRCTVMRTAEDELTGILAIDSDVTERRRAEKEIVLLNNVLEQRIRKRTSQLEESNEDLRDFAYSLAHDLRAPLASIDGFSAQLETLLAHQLDEQGRHYMRRVRAGVKLMADLTDALLALADISNTQLLHQNVDLSSIARGITERLREQEPHRHVTVVVEDTPPRPGRHPPADRCDGEPAGQRLEIHVQDTARRDHLRGPGAAQRLVPVPREGQRRGVRPGLRVQAVRSVPAAAHRQRVRGHGNRPRDGAKNRLAPRRSRLGRIATRRRCELFLYAQRERAAAPGPRDAGKGHGWVTRCKRQKRTLDLPSLTIARATRLARGQRVLHPPAARYG